MVEDRITDGRRIAEFLASELTGLERGPLARVTVVDADRDVTPSPAGPVAYRIALDGDAVGRVRVYESAAVVELDVEVSAVADSGTDGLRVATGESDEREENTTELGIESAAAVKRAVDLLTAALSE